MYFIKIKKICGGLTAKCEKLQNKMLVIVSQSAVKLRWNWWNQLVLFCFTQLESVQNSEKMSFYFILSSQNYKRLMIPELFSSIRC